MSNALAVLLAVAFLVLMVLVNLMRRLSRKRDQWPYLANTPRGLLVSKTGRRGDVQVLSWQTVSAKLHGGQKPWLRPSDAIHDLGVHLGFGEAREFFSDVQRRAARLSVNGQSGMSG